MEELYSRRCSDGRSGLPAACNAVGVQRNGSWGTDFYVRRDSDFCRVATCRSSQLRRRKLPVAEMIDRHRDGIAAYCRPENKVSLGFVEGLQGNLLNGRTD